MTGGSLAEPTLKSVETALREELARSNAVLSTAATVLRHLLAHGDNPLFSEEVVARTRGLLADLATQLLDALAEAIPAADPASFLAEHREAVATALADVPGLLTQVHATAVEGTLALRLEARGGIDPVLCPMLQELVASREEGIEGIAMAVLAAQARFIMHHREMTLPLSELPGDLFRCALGVLQSHAGNRADAAAAAVRNVSHRFDESYTRLGLLAQLVARTGGPAAALDLSRVGLAVFATALAQESAQERDLCLLSLADARSVRPALAMQAAGLARADVENQLIHLDAEVRLPEEFATLDPDHAALLLRGSSRSD